MGKGSKVIALILGLMGLACFAMYFVMGNESDYKVTFDSDGGTAVSEQIVKKGEKATKPDDPLKENSEFLEWQLDGVAYNFDNVVTKSMTLKASWKEIVKHNVKVTLEEKEYTADVVDGETITLEALTIPEKEGYKVVFYNEKDEEYDISKGLTEDVVLKAKYVEIKTYTVKFESNGGSKVESIKVQDGEKAEKPTDPTKDGYVFDGWYLGEEKFDFSTPITKDITLKARWNDGEKINVIFKVDDTTYKTIAVKENSKVTKPANPTKKGYKFVEWQLDGKAFDFNTKITEEITLIATFEESKSVTVTFVDEDGKTKLSSKEVETGGKVAKPTDPTKTGYKFVEWQVKSTSKKYDFNTAVNDDLTLKAVWVKVYTVKFVDSDKNTMAASQTVEDGGKVIKPNDPKKEGYKFSEWLLNNSTYNFNDPVTKDMELVARFEKVAATPTPLESDQSTGEVNSD